MIATNSGFVNAEDAKQALIDQYDELNTEYILVSGMYGGAMLAAAAMNALLMIQERYLYLSRRYLNIYTFSNFA